MRSSDDFSTTSTVLTPPTECNTTASLWSDRGAIPWPGNTYRIIEKHTNRAITLVNDLIVIKDIEDTAKITNGYFGFQHPPSGRYMGHDGSKTLRAKATELNDWEFFTPRQHPEGGYQLLSPYCMWSQALMVLCVDEGRKTVVRRNHGTTLWEFIKV
ncbi:unnamed protein product [Colletotrichum noveboracense]|uniref:Uncharacterized protein n=1 Tax=Colletotrichum noveboracense TaxID=2664923 RepID=A0A9W4S5R5_9PEZI|nr:unnamed protein product [Colletotrichum noveboracense]